jgi:8-oxo-dGTP pyrophosphatase MutT (NUDIX family)
MSEITGPYTDKITQKAVLFDGDGAVLITKVDDHWELPGGTFEFRETLVGGLRRELREELDLDTRVGPPVETLYGGWFDGENGNPMVTIIYRCETADDDTQIILNEEHDDCEWVSAATAAERLKRTFGIRLARAVERAAALDNSGPFAAVADPYADAEVTTEAVLEGLTEARNSDGPMQK